MRRPASGTPGVRRHLASGGAWRRRGEATPSAQCTRVGAPASCGPRPPLCGLAQLWARPWAQPISALAPTATADWPREGSQSELVSGSGPRRWRAGGPRRRLPALVPDRPLPGASRAAYVICTARPGVTPCGPPAPYQPPAALRMVARPRVMFSSRRPPGQRVMGRPPPH